MSRKLLSIQYQQKAFTLIELLVVLSVIAVLLGIIIPTYFNAREYAKQAKAKAEAKNLELAFREYESCYKKWPKGVFDKTQGNIEDNEIKDDLYKTLSGDNSGGDNPNEYAFMEFENVKPSDTNNPPPTYSAAYDPWQYDTNGAVAWQAYRVVCDTDYDNKINADGEDLSRSVGVWSCGRDRVDGTDDDIKSWD